MSGFIARRYTNQGGKTYPINTAIPSAAGRSRIHIPSRATRGGNNPCHSFCFTEGR